ncbi:hypothetical protein [Minwuia thermotolerans]|uniref:Uncharacterized protein n=1 Tax=Minwuia thermotolerans TaxID=2056226 RepID=A0A2M9FWM1_9PROT|nr:hypothetical protein [Minwuia thermotolerans]PJK27868.1 hypothetical protein CVT23_20575 [Minwuia thermotolerans]
MHTMTTNDPTRSAEYAEIAVEQLTVYRYVVALTDDINDPGAVALSRFTNGEEPDLGPADGEQHELTTYYIGAYQPEAEQR